MPGCELEPMEWSATDVGVGFGRFFSIGFFFSVFAAACSAGSIFWLPQRLLSERELLLVLGLSFYPLEQASKHGDLCNEQISDSNERFNLNRGGSVTTQAQGQTRAVAAKKVICGILAGDAKFSGYPFLLELVLSPSQLADGLSCIRTSFLVLNLRRDDELDGFRIRMSSELKNLGVAPRRTSAPMKRLSPTY